MFQAWDCLWSSEQIVLNDFNVSRSAERVVGIAGKQPVWALWEPLGVLSDEKVLNQALLLYPVSPRDLPLAPFPPVSQPPHSIKASLNHRPPPPIGQSTTIARFSLTKQTTELICLHRNAWLARYIYLHMRLQNQFWPFFYNYEKHIKNRKGFCFEFSYDHP